MSNAPEIMTLRSFCRFDDSVDRLGDVISDDGPDVRSIISHMTGFMQTETAQDSTIASINEGLSRIERRLDIQERPE